MCLSTIFGREIRQQEIFQLCFSTFFSAGPSRFVVLHMCHVVRVQRRLEKVFLDTTHHHRIHVHEIQWMEVGGALQGTSAMRGIPGECHVRSRFHAGAKVNFKQEKNAMYGVWIPDFYAKAHVTCSPPGVLRV